MGAQGRQAGVGRAATLRQVDALTRANQPYDLICLQNLDHFAGAIEGYTIKRTWDYFVAHLRGAAPVWDFKVAMRPIAPE
jgi:dipeptidyl-peptidase 4